MGYDLLRFISEVDEEFHCSICTMVLEDPVQSPCEHLFCNKCITDWLATDRRCPVDLNSFQLDDVKSLPRVFRNLLNKLEIKCDFRKRCYSKVNDNVSLKLFLFQNHKDARSLFH